MKFQRLLERALTSEWKDQYICYKKIKAIIYKLKPLEVSGNINESDFLLKHDNYYKELEDEFFALLFVELDKINTFYAEKVADAERKLNYLIKQVKKYYDAGGLIPGTTFLSSIIKSTNIPIKNRRVPLSDYAQFVNSKHEDSYPVDHPNMSSEHKKKLTKRFNQLKHSFSEFYLFLIKLNDYQQLNYTGFRKILKKHDKVISTKSGNIYFVEIINNGDFYKDNTIANLIIQTEEIYVAEFASSDRSKGMQELRVPSLASKKELDFSSFWFGCFFLPSVLLLILLIYRFTFTVPDGFFHIAHFFSSQLLLSVYIILFALNIYGWERSGVNRVLIFEINPRDHMSYVQMFLIGFMMLYSVLIVMVIYTYNIVLPLYSQWYPHISLLLLTLIFFNPLPFMFRSGRFWTINELARNLASGFFSVSFADFFMGDQLNSLSFVIADIAHALFFIPITLTKTDDFFQNPRYVVKYIFVCLPAYMRLAQCVRRYYDSEQIIHIFNLFKYLSSIIAYCAFAAYEYQVKFEGEHMSVAMGISIFFKMISTVYLLYWDIFIDWGMFPRTVIPLIFRKERIYKKKAFYFLAIIFDLITRNIWILAYLYNPNTEGRIFILSTVLGFLEIARRIVWNFFRLENEHLNNVGEYRAVRDISIKPLPKEIKDTVLENSK